MASLVLLPGMDGTGELFDPFLASLGSEFDVRVVRYPTVEPLNYAALEDVARTSMPNDGAFFILGESFSGPIAISMAASKPPNLKGLVLCCTFARNPRPAFGHLGSVVNFLPVHALPLGLVSPFLLGDFASNALVQALRQAMSRVSPSTLRERLRSVLAIDVSAKLAELKLPILYLRAARDRVVPPAASALVSKLSPHAQVVEIDAPHFMLQAVPDAAAKVICSFMRGAHVAL